MLAAAMVALTSCGAWRRTRVAARRTRAAHVTAHASDRRTRSSRRRSALASASRLDAGHGARAVPCPLGVCRVHRGNRRCRRGTRLRRGVGAPAGSTPELYGTPFDAAGFTDSRSVARRSRCRRGRGRQVSGTAASRRPTRVPASAYEPLRAAISGPTVVQWPRTGNGRRGRARRRHAEARRCRDRRHGTSRADLATSARCESWERRCFPLSTTRTSSRTGLS